MRKLPLFLFVGLVLFSAPARAEKLLTPEGYLEEPVWTAEEQQAPIARKLIRNTETSSIYWIRLKGQEEPHTHNDHDLIVVMIRGKATLQLADRTTRMLQGSMAGIARGLVHSAKNEDTEASLVYAVFTPNLEGQDYHPVAQETPKNP